MYHGICNAIYKELDVLDERLSNGTQMSNGDLELIDKMAHALKCLKTCDAMDGNSENDSYARGRSRTTGRYVSRDMSRDDYDSREYRRY